MNASQRAPRLCVWDTHAVAAARCRAVSRPFRAEFTQRESRVVNSVDVNGISSNRTAFHKVRQSGVLYGAATAVVGLPTRSARRAVP